jgi:colicin import membrane protein
MKHGITQLLQDSGSTTPPKEHLEDEVVTQKLEKNSDEKQKPELETKQEVETPEEVNPEKAREDLEKYIKELRAEAAKARVEKKEIKAESDARLEQLQKELEAAKEAEKELARIRKEQDERKKSTEEKLTARELELRQKEEEVSEIKAKMQQTELRLQEFLKQQEEEKRIKEQVYSERVEEEIAKLPEDKQKFARTIVKGAGNLEEGLMALLEAKRENLFGVKKVEVAHSIPKEEVKQKENVINNNKLKIKHGLASKTSNMKPGAKLI